MFHLRNYMAGRCFQESIALNAERFCMQVKGTRLNYLGTEGMADEIHNSRHDINYLHQSIHGDVFNNNIPVMQYERKPIRFLERQIPDHIRLLWATLQPAGMVDFPKFFGADGANFSKYHWPSSRTVTGISFPGLREERRRRPPESVSRDTEDAFSFLKKRACQYLEPQVGVKDRCCKIGCGKHERHDVLETLICEHSHVLQAVTLRLTNRMISSTGAPDAAFEHPQKNLSTSPEHLGGERHQWLLPESLYHQQIQLPVALRKLYRPVSKKVIS